MRGISITLCVILALFYVVSFADARDGGEIHLKGRKLIPAEDTDAIKVDVIEGMRKGKRRVHGILQLHKIPDKKEIAEMEMSGITLLDYIPENSWLVSISGEGVIPREVIKYIKWIGLVSPEDKIDTGIRERGIAPWARQPDGKILLRIKYFRDVTPDEVKTAMESLGATLLRSSPDFHYLEIAIEEGEIPKIASEDIVQWIEQVPPPPAPHNDGSRVNIGADVVQAPTYSLSGSGVDVGQWDDGDVDSTHDDFGSRVTKVDNVGFGATHHATHVAGTIGGSGLRSSGTYKGIAPGVNIFSYNIMGAPPSYLFPPPAHNGAITNYGIEISNNSWGDSIGSYNCDQYGNYSMDSSSFDQIVTGIYGKHITIVFSAGNERNDGNCPNLTGGGSGNPYYANITPPSTAKNVVTVGAINSDNNTMTIDSSWGPVDDGRIKPDVVAPGDQVGGDGGIRSTVPVDTYAVMSGTSMAAAAVSGSAALIIEDYRSIHGSADPIPSTVKALLVHGAEELGNQGPDFSYGYGKVNVQNSIDLLRAGGLMEGEVGHQESHIFYLNVPEGATSVKVTLVWDDIAATSNAAIALVNDLDLIVRNPSGVRYFPWVLDILNPDGTLNSSNFPLPAVRTMEDHRNNIEQVGVNGTLAPGLWTVEVLGYAVPSSTARQKYSLVFTPESPLLGVSVTPKEPVYNSTAVPTAIPAGNPGATTALTIPDDLIISGIHVYVDIPKPNGSCCYYRITLTSPSGTSVVLFDDIATGTFQTWFDTITASLEPLSRFAGETSSGTWFLNVTDNSGSSGATLNNWRVKVITRSWAIGTAESGTTMTMTQGDRFIVQNIGNAPETFTMQVSDTGGTWSASPAETGNGVDTFVMSGMFSSSTDTSPGSADFNTLDSDDVIPSSYAKAATSTYFAGDAMTENGVNVQAGSSRALHLQFKAPTGTSVLGSQHIGITVGAMPQ